MNHILFFAQLRERLACDNLEFAAQGLTINQLKQQLAQLYPDGAFWLLQREVLAAVNHQVVDANTLIQPNDEIAFFPPVTGG